MGNVMTPKFRVSFPAVFRPKVNQLSGKEEYSLTALFEKGADLKALEAAAKEAGEKKWGTDYKKWPKPMKSPFRQVTDMAKEGVLPAGLEEYTTFIRLKSTQRPGLVDNKNQPIIDENEVYGGCFCRATVRAYAYDNAGNRGVAFGLQNVQKISDGQTLGGRPRAEDEFSPVEGLSEQEELFK